VIQWWKDEEEIQVMEKICPREYRDRAHKVII